MLRGADLALRYLSNRGRPRRRLDRSSVYSRFPSQLKATIGLHGSAPRLQQSAGATATWVVRFELVNEPLSGDSLVLIGPQEYEFDISEECRNVVSSLAAPSCSGNVLLVSNVGASDALGRHRSDSRLHGVRCGSPQHETNDERGAIIHCRSESQLDIQDLRVAPCSNIITSKQYELWPVIPELTSPGRRCVTTSSPWALS